MIIPFLTLFILYLMFLRFRVLLLPLGVRYVLSSVQHFVTSLCDKFLINKLYLLTQDEVMIK